MKFIFYYIPNYFIIHLKKYSTEQKNIVLSKDLTERNNFSNSATNYQSVNISYIKINKNINRTGGFLYSL